MIERQGCEFVASCDSCTWEEFFETSDWEWQDVVDEIKGDGWAIRKRGGEWVHTCPDCVQVRKVERKATRKTRRSR